MADGSGYTVAGVVAGALIAVAPKLAERLTGRKHDNADGAEILSSGAGAVTTAALALLDRHDEDAERAREAEEKCRIELAAVNARCDALVAEVAELRAFHFQPPDSSSQPPEG